MFIPKVRNTIKRFRMLRVSDSVLVAVSGGPDSVALLHTLLALRPEYRLTLTIAHFNHQLRSEASDADAQFVAELADRLRLDYRVGTGAVRAYARRRNLSLEEAGRMLRYRFLRATAHTLGATRVALGHTRDDQAETVLLRLLRGAGTTGLCGIHPVLPLPDGTALIRPLIACGRADVLDFLRTQAATYREDPSNQDLRFDRNRVRAGLLPYLAAEFNPRVTMALAQHAALAQEEEAWVAPMAETEAARLWRSQDDELRIAAAELAARPVALQRRLVRWALQKLKGDLRRIEYAHVEALRALCQDGMSGKQVHLPGGLCAHRAFAHLILSRKELAPAPAFSYRLPIPGCVSVPEAGCIIRAECLPARDPAASDTPDDRVMTAWFDAQTVGAALIVRNRRPGDRGRLRGGRRKLKAIFIDRKVPRRRRDRIPLITRAIAPDSSPADPAGSSPPTEILWIPGCPPPPVARADRWVRVTIERMKDER